jgi:hypothetical protein
MIPLWLVLIPYALASSVAIFFAGITWGWFVRIDRPRENEGVGFARIGRLPLTHHIPEFVTFFFFGQAIQWIAMVTGTMPLTPLAIILGIDVALTALSPWLAGWLRSPRRPFWPGTFLALVVINVGFIAGVLLPFMFL